MTRCFEVKLGLQKEAITHSLSPGKIRPSPWPADIWNPRKEQIFTPEGKFTDRWRSKVTDLWMLINPDVKELPNVIGEFTRIRNSPPPAVDERTKKTIESMDPDLCDFAPVGKIWDERFEREIDTPQFYFISIRRFVDCWDRNHTQVTEMQRSDGTTFFRAEHPFVVRGSIIEDELLWHDSSSGHILCTEAFKSKIEASGSLGFWFYEIGVDAVFNR